VGDHQSEVDADHTTLRSRNFEGDEGDYDERFSGSLGEMLIVRLTDKA
jgi:hypothetical protein